MIFGLPSVNSFHSLKMSAALDNRSCSNLAFCFLVSWQITPRVLTEALAAGGEEAKRAFDAIMSMKKIDVAVIKSARRG